MSEFFLSSIGWFNLLGSVVLYAMLNPTVADIILHKWASIVVETYDVGKYGVLWLWWAATTNVFFGIINITAATWNEPIQIAVIKADVLTYIVFLTLAIAALKSTRYGQGNYINILLFSGWILWGICCLVSG